MKVVFADFDGTLFDERESLKKASLEVLSRELDKEEIRRLPKEIKSKIYEINITKYYYLYEPIKDGIKKIIELKKENYYIVILTARLCKYKKYIEEILKKYNVPYDELICRDNLSLKDEVWKAKVIESFLRKYKIEEIVVLEDKQENLDFIEKYLKRNIKKILIYVR